MKSPELLKKEALFLVIAVALLFAIGLLMVFNTTAAEIIDRSLATSTHASLFKQITYALAGACLGAVLYAWGYENLLKYSQPLLICATVLLALVFVPGIGMKINGARRWLGVAGVAIGQPSECVKVLLPAAYIHWFLQQRTEIDFKAFAKRLAWFAIPLGLIFLEPDNGTTFIICLVFAALFLLTRIRLAYWAAPLAVLVLMGTVAAFKMPHVHNRLEVYLHPESDLRGKGHQPHQAKIAAGSGQLWGRGLGESLQKLNYLPEARSDYIAAIYAEEMGFVGVVALILLYLVIASGGFAIAMQAQERGAFLLAASLTFLISMQAFINLGVVCGLLPSKGMTLPFFSQGGSSLIVNIAILFLLLDIARKKRCEEY